MTESPNGKKRLKSLCRMRLGAVLGLPALLFLLLALSEVIPLPAQTGSVFIALVVADLVFILVLNHKIRNAVKAAAPSVAPGPKPARKLTRTLILAGWWFSLDALVFQQGMISLLLLVHFLFWMHPSAIMVRRNPALLRFRAWRAAAYLLAASTALGVIRLNNALAERRAETVIAVVREYQQKKGEYPGRLAQVTPEFLPSIPIAKYSLMYNEFQYFGSADSPRLFYVAFPPFGRKIYYFESGRWGQLD